MRWIFRSIIVLLVLATTWYANIVWEWLPRPSMEQVAALQALESHPIPSGKADAFATLWFLTRRVPEASQQDWLARDVAAWIDARRPGSDSAGFAPPSASEFPRLPMPGPDERLCENWTTTCLERVTSDPEAARAALAEFRDYEANLARLQQHDHAINPFPSSLAAPLPDVGSPGAIGLTRIALTAVDEGPDAGLHAACSWAATWRRLRANTDMLVLDMIGVTQVSGSAQLAAAIIASAPAATAWPAECREAFAPLAANELVRCAEHAREFQMLDEWRADPALTIKGAKAINWSHVRAVTAPAFAASCRGPTRSGSQRLEPPAGPLCSLVDRMLDPFGCMLTTFGEGDYAVFRDRVLDLDGRLATLRTALWLREQHDDPARAFAARPVGLRTPEHDVDMDIAAGTLSMRALEQHPQRAIWTIPFTRPEPSPE